MPWAKGESGNPGGRPKGAKTLAYSVRQLVGEVLSEQKSWDSGKDSFRSVLGDKRRVVSGLEFAARVNKEIGLGSDEVPMGVSIIVNAPLDKTKLQPKVKA